MQDSDSQIKYRNKMNELQDKLPDTVYESKYHRISKKYNKFKKIYIFIIIGFLITFGSYFLKDNYNLITEFEIFRNKTIEEADIAINNAKLVKFNQSSTTNTFKNENIKTTKSINSDNINTINKNENEKKEIIESLKNILNLFNQIPNDKDAEERLKNLYYFHSEFIHLEVNDNITLIKNIYNKYIEEYIEIMEDYDNKIIDYESLTIKLNEMSEQKNYLLEQMIETCKLLEITLTVKNNNIYFSY